MVAESTSSAEIRFLIFIGRDFACSLVKQTFAGLVNLIIELTFEYNLAVHHDQRKEIEEQLYISEARYRLLSNHAHDVIWSIAPDGSITFVSPSIEQVRGYSPEQAMRQPLEEIRTPDSIALNRAYFAELLGDIATERKPKSFRGHMEYLCKDGSTYWCEVMATPILAEDGSVLIVHGQARGPAPTSTHPVVDPAVLMGPPLLSHGPRGRITDER